MKDIDNEIKSLHRKITALRRDGRPRYSEDLRREVFALHDRSGLPLSRFAEAVGLSANLLYKWPRSQSPKSDFRRVEIVEDRPSPSGISVETPGGVRIH